MHEVVSQIQRGQDLTAIWGSRPGLGLKTQEQEHTTDTAVYYQGMGRDREVAVPTPNAALAICSQDFKVPTST